MTNKKTVHRGEIVEEAIRLSGIPVSSVAKDIGYSRQHMYMFFDNPDLGVDIVMQIGKVIKHDFTKDIPNIFTPAYTELKEPRAEYKKESELLKQCLEEKNAFKQKYYDIMEAHNKLLEEHNRLLNDKLHGRA